MTGETGRVLYVGQSKNLRTRLGTYKNANPDHVPRKIIRLVHAVRKIDWEECATPTFARVRENELLRTLRPKFNSMNTYPRAYCFIGIKTGEREFTVWITSQETAAPKLYGAFKRRSMHGYAALLRLGWAALYQPSSPGDFPHRLLSGRSPSRYSFSTERIQKRIEVGRWEASFEAFLSGVSPELIELLTANLPLSDHLPPFHRTLQATDLETLGDFYKFGPQRNHAIRQQQGMQSLQIPQESLDDLLALFPEKPENTLRSCPTPPCKDESKIEPD